MSPHKDPEALKAWRRGYMKRRRALIGDKLRAQERIRSSAVKEFLRCYKLTVGCVDCGYRDHHTALDFDHVRGTKSINVCFARSERQAREEILKCEVVCSNCHRIRTFNRIHFP